MIAIPIAVTATDAVDATALATAACTARVVLQAGIVVNIQHLQDVADFAGDYTSREPRSQRACGRLRQHSGQQAGRPHGRHAESP